MTKQKIYGICCGNTQSTSFGFDEENESYIKLTGVLNSYFRELDGDIMTTCNLGLELFVGEAAISQGKDVICIIPYENQAAKWADSYRERYFTIHEKSKQTKMLSTQYYNDCKTNSEKYIAENCDEMIVILSKGEDFPYGARHALELNKKITIIDCDDFSIYDVK